MKNLLWILLLLTITIGEKLPPKNEIAQKDQDCLVFFWNLENFFTTSLHFYEKLNRVAKHIFIASEGNLPVIIGVSEIENFQVAWRLVNVTALARGEYGVVHADSPDHRGIDVALFYRKDRFKLLSRKFHLIKNKEGEVMRTRSILYAKGVLDQLDTLHFFVMHWPSKWGGAKASFPAREAAAATLLNLTDSILLKNQASNIVVMGDLNEEAEGVSALLPSLSLLYPSKQSVPGTIKYNGRWEIIDHFLLSLNLFNRDEPIFCTDSSAFIYSHPNLIEKDRAYLGIKPKRSFIGPRYNGGVSDHLPIILRIRRSW